MPRLSRLARNSARSRGPAGAALAGLTAGTRRPAFTAGPASAAVTAFASDPAVAASSVATAAVVAAGAGRGSDAGSRERWAADDGIDGAGVGGDRGDLRDHRRGQERTGSRNLTDHVTTPVYRGVAWLPIPLGALLTCHRSALPRAPKVLTST
jgi:hypothetical protein